jgi:hypothetical protein
MAAEHKTIWFYPDKQHIRGGPCGATADSFLKAIILIKKLGFKNAILVKQEN